MRRFLKRTLKVLKWVILIPIVLLIILNLAGCFQFRSSNKKSIRDFEKDSLTLHAGSYKAIGRNINYRSINEGEKKPLVIYVHGSPGSSQDFFNTMKDSVMLAHFEMMCIDRPGYGYSDFGNAEPDLDKQAQVLGPLISENKERKVILIGHSYGGPVVARAAMLYNDMLHGCVVVAGSVSPELEPNEKWRGPMHHPLLRWIFPTAMRVSNDEILPLKDELTRILTDWSRITIPMYVVQGEKDFLVPPGNAHFIQKQCVNCEDLRLFMYPEENHFIPFTKHEYIRDAVIEIMRNHP